MKSLLLEVNKRERCASRLDVDELREWWDYGQIKVVNSLPDSSLLLCFVAIQKVIALMRSQMKYIIVMRRVNDVISFLCLQSYPTCIHRR